MRSTRQGHVGGQAASEDSFAVVTHRRKRRGYATPLSSASRLRICVGCGLLQTCGSDGAKKVLRGTGRPLLPPPRPSATPPRAGGELAVLTSGDRRLREVVPRESGKRQPAADKDTLPTGRVSALCIASEPLRTLRRLCVLCVYDLGLKTQRPRSETPQSPQRFSIANFNFQV